MTTLITCPNCGTENEDPQGSRSSRAFCGGCDYPLFFSRGVTQYVVDDSDMAHERLPGVAGLVQRSWLPCPDCGELNPRDGVNCLRCGAILVSPAEEEVVDEIEIRTIVREVLVAAEKRKRWPLLLVGSLLGSAITIGIYYLAIWIW